MPRAKKLPADRGFNAEFFAKFADQGPFRDFAGFDFPAREFPLQGMRIVPPPLADQNPGVAQDQSCHDRKFRLPRFVRSALGCAVVHIFSYVKSGFGLSRLISRSLTAFCTTSDSIFPSRNNSYSVASVMNRASTSKKSRSAGRPSLRPNPSVPSDARRRGVHRLMRLGSAFR